MVKKEASSDPTYPLDHQIPFEVFHKGSWHPADLVSIYDGNISVQTKHPIPMVLVNIQTDFLRMRSRKATSLDCCNFLRPGIDVCVLLPQPASSNSDNESPSQHLVWLDARIIKIKRSHADTCNCVFAVMPYKYDGPIHMQKLVSESDHTSITLVKINHISILQGLCHKSDQNGNIFPCSTKNRNSINKTKLFNFTDTFAPAIATLLVFSTLCSVIEVKIVQDRVIYIVREDNMNQNGLTVNMKVVNFIYSNGVISPKVERLSIEPTCMEEKGALTGAIKESFAVCTADNVCEEMSIRRSKREIIQPDFLACYMSHNFGRSSYAPSANVPSSSKSQQKRELANDEGTLRDKQAMRSSAVRGNSKQKAIQKEKNRRHYQAVWSSAVKGNSKRKAKEEKMRHYRLYKKYSAKQKNYISKGCEDFKEELIKEPDMQNEMPTYRLHEKHGTNRLHEKHGAKGNYFNKKHGDLIDELLKDDGMQRKKGQPYKLNEKYGAKRKHVSTKECDDFIEELMTNIRCCMNKKAKLGIQQDEEVCASAPGYYPIEEDFTWPPTDSDGKIEEEKDEYEDIWEERDNCLNMLALEEEKKNSESVDQKATREDKEELCVHDCVLNEQVGLICKKCNVVQTEIRDIFPPMMKEQSYQTPTDKASSRNNPFEIDPSFLKTPTSKPNQSKYRNNIWTPILEIEPKLKPHQRRAFEFIWKNLIGSLEPEKMNNANGNTGGCVISHSPGSGKTLTVITFLVSYLAMFPQSHPLVLTPKSAIHIWEREFEKWGIKVPVHIIHQDISFATRTLFGKSNGYLDAHRRPSNKAIRIMDSLEKVQLWHENPGVLLMTYPSFFSFMNEGSRNEYYEFMANILQTSPGLLVLDEGHNPRSTKSKLRKLLMKVNTDSRIILSGTVFQNNFEEYFNTLCLARPQFVRDVITELDNVELDNVKRRGRKPKNEEKHAQRLFVENIGNKVQSQDRIERKYGFDLLRKMTSGFINAFNGEKLQNLPGLETYTIFLQCTKTQEKILQTLQNSCKTRSRYPLEIEFLVSVGAIHPCLVSTSKAAKTFFTENELKEIGSQRNFFSRGSKTSFVIDVILKSLMTKEKVLVFSHNLEPLKLLIELIGSAFGWCEGSEILFLYGDQNLSERSEIIDKFNGDKERKRKVLLASTNACAEGISLTAASRIVLLDSEWNHSKTKQAIARAYRPGQEKMVYVYLLLAAGSWEENKYESNKKKAQLSKMVLSGQCIDGSSAGLVNGDGITDEMLREIVEEDNKRTVKMVVKHE
ncbi:DNA repair and recombination protein RAD54-like [Rhynchospora pubera]|uniref:DNA repair and recombination protein RAD54-like n=1 Tax=Rhynchospora pubera TaxID=906938 RepID=A0AAV8CF78_9POAL|nr:DNA repair and recombination protein RAD54-like [Rhynchospora pubera]